jgi:hypothetical protein
LDGSICNIIVGVTIISKHNNNINNSIINNSIMIIIDGSRSLLPNSTEKKKKQLPPSLSPLPPLKRVTDSGHHPDNAGCICTCQTTNPGTALVGPFEKGGLGRAHGKCASIGKKSKKDGEKSRCRPFYTTTTTTVCIDRPEVEEGWEKQTSFVQLHSDRYNKRTFQQQQEKVYVDGPSGRCDRADGWNRYRT